jgi:hypothetical protein
MKALQHLTASNLSFRQCDKPLDFPEVNISPTSSINCFFTFLSIRRPVGVIV